jgi:hypothetical protein
MGEEAWKFVRHYQITWYWRHTLENGPQRVSSRTFRIFEECLEDAIKTWVCPRDREPCNDCVS